MNDDPSSTNWTARSLVAIGGCALLVAMLTDTLAVVGRHTGIPLIGSIEVVQAAVLIAASSGLVLATLARVHAAVRLVLDHVSRRARSGLLCVNRLLGAVFFAALLVGSIWIAADLWSSQEESELLKIPFRPLRLATILALATLVLSFLRQAFESPRR
jgi:TRAP-type C4-dicarboxylate transport system permease small subunit